MADKSGWFKRGLFTAPFFFDNKGMKRPSRESGSALIYILIAIALFAALSYAVAQMMRGGDGTTNEELRRLQATEILQFGRSLRTAVQGMEIDGIADTEISFETAAVAGYANGGCGGNECKIFSPAGGGMNYSAPVAADWLDQSQVAGANFGQWVFSGDNAVANVGTAAPDLLVMLPWVTRSLCTEINDLLSVTNPGGIPPQDNGNADVSTKFTGTYTASQSIGGGDPEIEGQRAGCFEGAGAPAAGTYHFFQVLIAR